MSIDAWVNYILVAAVVVGILIAAFLVHRMRLRWAKDQIHPLDRGWQFYFTPTTMEPPGTIYRMDAEHKRYIYDTLKLPIQRGEEAFGEYKESLDANMGIFARFLGLKDSSINVKTAKSEQFVFKLDDPKREFVTDVDLNKVLQSTLKEMEKIYIEGNRYFVIRDWRTATGITYHLSNSQVTELGGESSLSNLLTLKGALFKSERSGEYFLEKKFNIPMGIMYLPEEIKQVTAGLAGEPPRFGLVPVKETLVWEEG